MKLARNRWMLAAAAGAASVVVSTGGAARAADDGFAAFWKVFAPAMAKDDKAALARMVGPTLGPFATFHSYYLKAKVRRCIATGKPQANVDSSGAPSYFVKCGSTDYVFVKEAGAWKLDDMELDD